MTRAFVDSIVEDFCRFACVAGFPLEVNEIDVEFLPAPHNRPRSLQTGKMAVYVFGMSSCCLKVGKAGPKTAARYNVQHYNTRSAPSTLAASIIKHAGTNAGSFWPPDSSPPDLNDIGVWLEQNVWRANFLLDAHHSPLLLNLLEAFAQCRFRPLFEGAARDRSAS